MLVCVQKVGDRASDVSYFIKVTLSVIQTAHHSLPANMKLTFALWASTAATLATAQTSNFTRCALGAPAAAQVAQLDAAAREGAENQYIARFAARNVPVYVHVVTTTAKRGRYTQRMINDQIAVCHTIFYT